MTTTIGKELVVLIVDDEDYIRALLREILSEHEGPEKYKLLEAANGERALDLVRNQPVDIIITDIKMPGMSGFDLLKMVKSEKPLVGVIVMTAYQDIYSKKDALLLGAEEYISKPFDNEEISLVMKATYWKIMAHRIGR